jgi:single-strand DNA-binding protein
MTGTPNVGLVGYLAGDPELRFTPNGKSVCELEVAVRPYVPQGEPQPETQYHKIVCFGSLAEHVAKCVSKGDRVVVTGTPKTETWTGRDGKDRTTTKIIADGIGPDLRWNLARIEEPDKPKPAPVAPADEEPF